MKLGRQGFCAVAWQLLSSFFADVLSKEQWLKVRARRVGGHPP
jgi:hypothetical protein